MIILLYPLLICLLTGAILALIGYETDRKEAAAKPTRLGCAGRNQPPCGNCEHKHIL